MMSKQLPYVEPLFCTYHYLANHGVVAQQNPTGYIWFLNNCIQLHCSNKFLTGYGDLKLSVSRKGFFVNPNIEMYATSSRFCSAEMTTLIKRMLDEDFYIIFNNLDDYYVEGKSFYQERHFYHDGLIIGYDDEENTYSFVAYDKTMNYRAFKVSDYSLNEAISKSLEAGEVPRFLAVKSYNYPEALDYSQIIDSLNDYLNPKEAKNLEGDVNGVDIYESVILYLDKLSDQSISHDKMDWRIMRLIWEHKKCMLLRIQEIEKDLNFSNEASSAYQKIVDESKFLHILYAQYHIKAQDRLLPVMKKKLENIVALEKQQLTEFLHKLTNEVENALEMD